MIDISQLTEEEKTELLIALGGYKRRNLKHDFYYNVILKNLSFVENEEVRVKIYNLIEKLTDFATGNYSISRSYGGGNRITRNHCFGIGHVNSSDYKNCALAILNIVENNYSKSIDE